jgi:2-iminobutanoate/2-iminopropanoate deaminase
MSKIVALFAALAAQVMFQVAPISAQEAMEKKSYNYSAWTPGIFSEAVTITNMGKGKFIFLAGIGAEDENGPRGAIRHKGDFAAQCGYAYDKIKRALAANGSSLKDAVKMTVYVTDMRNRLDWAKCSGEAFRCDGAGADTPRHQPARLSRNDAGDRRYGGRARMTPGARTSVSSSEARIRNRDSRSSAMSPFRAV